MSKNLKLLDFRYFQRRFNKYCGIKMYVIWFNYYVSLSFKSDIYTYLFLSFLVLVILERKYIIPLIVETKNPIGHLE